MIMLLIILSTLCVILETLDSLKGRVEFYYIECVVCIIFTIEYLIRLACSGKPWAFMTKMLNIIDVISFIPFYIRQSGVMCHYGELRVVRTIRLSRMIRMLKLGFFADYMLVFSET